jgi:hypothetical protein
MHELVTMLVLVITMGLILLLEESQKQGIRSWAAISRGLLYFYFWWHLQNCKRWLLALSYLSASLSICSSVPLSAWNNSALTRLIFMKFDIWTFFKNLLRKFKFYYNLTSIRGILHEDCYTSLTVSCSVLLRGRNVSDKCCTENQNTHCTFSNVVWKSCHLWDNVEKYRTAEHHIAFWITKATTHTQNM